VRNKTMVARTLRLLTCVALLAASGSFHAVAGTFLYRTCARNDGAAAATGFTAALPQGGLFSGVTGSFAVLQPGNCFVPRYGNVIANQGFLKPMPSFSVPFLPNVTINPGSLMVLSTIRNGNNTSLNLKGSFFTDAIGAPLTTAFGNATIFARGDPEVDVTNVGSSLLTITGFEALVNNSEDPLDLTVNFVPDGSPVTVDNSGGLDLASNQTAMFTFALPDNTINWAFQVSYNSSEGSFSQLVATDVPEESSLILMATAIGILAVYVRVNRRLRWKIRLSRPAG
jgi:hypothetical protein